MASKFLKSTKFDEVDYYFITYCSPFEIATGLRTIICPEEDSSVDTAVTVCLLYRPGHYDILYAL